MGLAMGSVMGLAKGLAKGLAIGLAMGLAMTATVAALDVPYLTGRVVDTAEILSPAAREQIADILKAHEDRTSNQIAVLTVPSLEGDNIEDFAARVFEAWRLGRAEQNNGLLVVVALNDRRMRIEVGYGLEGELTDLAAGRVIRNVMTPRFKDGDYDAGIRDGVSSVIAILEGTGEAAGDVAGGTAEGQDGESSSGLHLEGPDLPLAERILFGAFIFGIIGLFTIIGVVTPGMGWFLYVFLIPFWAMFPIIVVGVKGALGLLAAYVVAFPAAKLLLSRSAWYQKARTDLKTKGHASIGGFKLSSGSSGSSGGSSRSSSWSSSRSSFSGGGGRSGGGGASGGW